MQGFFQGLLRRFYCTTVQRDPKHDCSSDFVPFRSLQQEDAIRAEEERIAQYAAEKERREEERRQLEKKKADDQGR
jgi:hypothetical protein